MNPVRLLIQEDRPERKTGYDEKNSRTEHR